MTTTEDRDTVEACAAEVRRLAPLIADAYRRINEAREAAGVEPGEPLFGIFADPDLILPQPDADGWIRNRIVGGPCI